MLSEWTDALERLGKRLGKNGNWQCPAHEDHNPSMSLKEENGKVLVKCFAGCTFEQIKDALGLTRTPPRSAVAGGARKNPTPTSRKPPRKPPKRVERLPDLPTWYYHDADGERAFAVQRIDHPEGKSFIQWTPDGAEWVGRGLPGKRPLYRLPDLLKSEGVVAIVEGEKCAEACVKAWPTQAVTTWSGGADSWARTDWTPLKGRTVSIVADADHIDPKRGNRPGHEAGRGIALILHELGCKVKLALPLPEGQNNEDVADWLAEDGLVETGKRVGKMLEDFQPPEPAPETPPEPDQPSIPPEAVRENEHYTIVGLVGPDIAIRLKRAGQIIRKGRESMIKPAVLIALASEVWWCQLTGAPELSQRTARRIGDTLIREADNIGQVDLSAIRGRGAARLPDGSIAYHLGDRILINGTEQDLDFTTDVHWLAEPPIPLVGSATDKQMRAFAEAMLGYRWGSVQDARRMLGWSVAAMVGGALEWRPHILLVAPAATGKSWLLKRLKNLMGPLVFQVVDATAAGIARLTAHTSIPVMIDEAEPNAGWVMHLLALLRNAAGSDGLRVRAEQGSSGFTSQQARFSALLSSTTSPRLTRADESRLTSVSLGEKVEDWPAVMAKIDASLKVADAIRSRIVRTSADIARAADALGDEFQGQGMDSRTALCSASLSAGWLAWGLDEKWVFSTTQVHDDSGNPGQSLLYEILTSRHRAAGEDSTIITMLKDDSAAGSIAGLYGIKRTPSEDGMQDHDSIAIAPHHPGLRTQLQRTEYKDADLRTTLLQIKGTVSSNSALRFGGVRHRAIEFSYQVLQALGIDWSNAND